MTVKWNVSDVTNVILPSKLYFFRYSANGILRHKKRKCETGKKRKINKDEEMPQGSRQKRR